MATSKKTQALPSKRCFYVRDADRNKEWQPLGHLEGDRVYLAATPQAAACAFFSQHEFPTPAEEMNVIVVDAESSYQALFKVSFKPVAELERTSALNRR
jgi:hypothetical protein